MPFFSIIIPTYNRAHLLASTLTSIFYQTYTDYEILVVDDGSTDNTADRIQELISAHTDRRIYYFRKPNGERGAARNFGAKNCNGKYLIFFDSDDVMYPEHLHTVYRHIVAEGFPEIAYTGYELTDIRSRSKRKILVKPRFFKYKLLRNNFLACDSVIISEDLFKKYWFNEDRRLATAEDKQLWLRICANHKFHFIPSTSFAIVQHDSRSLNQLTIQRKEERLKILIQSLEECRRFKKGFGILRNIFYAREYALVASEQASAGNCKKALFYIKMAVHAYPFVILTRRFVAATKNYFVAIARYGSNATGAFGKK